MNLLWGLENSKDPFQNCGGQVSQLLSCSLQIKRQREQNKTPHPNIEKSRKEKEVTKPRDFKDVQKVYNNHLQLE